MEAELNTQEVKATPPAGYKGPEAHWETITSIMARRWLEDFNKHNRNVSAPNLKNISSDMKRGDFQQTGDTIKFDWNGLLIDGQHRLRGIMESDMPQKMLVVRGLDPDAFKYIDRGKNRTAGDILSIEGIANPSRIAAIAKFIINFKRGQYFAVAGRHAKTSRARITNSEISGFVDANVESLLESYKYGFGKGSKKQVLSGTYLASFHFIFKALNEHDADDFCHKLSNGRDLADESPIAMLRDKLIQDIRAKKKMPNIQRMAVVIKAWNFYRSKRTTKNLIWNSLQEAFPKPN